MFCTYNLKNQYLKLVKQKKKKLLYLSSDAVSQLKEIIENYQI